MRTRFLGAVSVAALFIASPATADDYDWTFTGTSAASDGAQVIGSGLITTGAQVQGGGFDITGITGSFDGYSILGLATFGAGDYSGDQVLYPDGNAVTLDADGNVQNCIGGAESTCLAQYLDNQGLSFALDAPPLTDVQNAPLVAEFLNAPLLTASLNAPPLSLQQHAPQPAVITIATYTMNGQSNATPCCFMNELIAQNNFLSSGTFTVEFTPRANCFVKGTRILTAKGQVEIERLTAEDDVITVRGVRKRIKHIERQVLAPSFAHMPIRISRGALGERTPSRDLYVSAAHCLFVDGFLIPAVDLINGATIARWITLEPIEYYHIELDAHEIIYAEGAGAETLLAAGMVRCAPFIARNGGRSELKALLRRLAQPLVDVRDPIQIARDRLDKRIAA